MARVRKIYFFLDTLFLMDNIYNIRMRENDYDNNKITKYTKNKNTQKKIHKNK